MMRPDAKVEKIYLYPKPVDFRKSIDGQAALVELDIKVAVFDPELSVTWFSLWGRYQACPQRHADLPSEPAMIMAIRHTRTIITGVTNGRHSTNPIHPR
ncbi:IS66 family insertion sequence element accessory protein TnpB [Pseudomonas sp. DCB_BI]|uniref:IS66 family insertion sequence element accessory protein TnpB n=1 Tax=Pseudomonas sp. DCB_BI TaxID=2993594 RepID=UPI00224A69C0|nr:IS66 family insertion sequence element accessory protein TnpB [Pseudomonas sp. DCB_BI]MCX2889221.1 IS66 family insertion sequence element accessory protein TnpB [Pseudomonas sp. DCB_BI]